MLITGIFLLSMGVFMISKPSVFWLLFESWKSNDATEPSSLYIWSTRFGGIMFIVVGICLIIAVYLL